MSFGSFGSGPGPHQKLTSEYLARQLPVFQERVPTSPKVRDNVLSSVCSLGGRERRREKRRKLGEEIGMDATINQSMRVHAKIVVICPP